MKNKKYDIYLAAPWFNAEQEEREAFVKQRLKDLGYKVFCPKDETCINPNATIAEREQAFKANCEAIDNSKVVLAITDGKDIGTIWEAGYAYGKNISVAYFCETLKGNPFNLMLAHSGVGIIENRDDLTFVDLQKILYYKPKAVYAGEIE
jgi:nucleoside 2-deoxyribosyltransferase